MKYYQVNGTNKTLKANDLVYFFFRSHAPIGNSTSVEFTCRVR